MPRATILLKKCPGCAKRLKLYRMTSTDTSMAKFWTDGKMEAPLIPDLPEFVKCPFCDVPFWVAEAETLAQEEQKLFAPDRWKDARFVRIPGHTELCEAIDTGYGDTEEHEIYLRMPCDVPIAIVIFQLDESWDKAALTSTNHPANPYNLLVGEGCSHGFDPIGL